MDFVFSLLKTVRETQRYANLINSTLKQAIEVFGNKISNIGLEKR